MGCWTVSCNGMRLLGALGGGESVLHVGTVVTSPHLRAFTALCHQFSPTFSRVGLCDRQYMTVVYNLQYYVIKDLVSVICTLSFVSLPLGEASCYDDSETAMETLMNRGDLRSARN